MPAIISYRKFINTEITRELRLPVDGQHQTLGTELATLADGTTYVCLPDGAVLPLEQPEEIAASIQTVTLDAVTRAAIISASPHCKLIDERMREQIRGAYPLEDELKYARIGVGAAMGMYVPTSDEMQAMTVFGVHVEAVRQWGRDRRAEFGL